MPTPDEMVAAVKAHAMANYSKGWDVVIECYTDSAIREEVMRCTSITDAIRKMRQGVDIHEGQRREVVATAW